MSNFPSSLSNQMHQLYNIDANAFEFSHKSKQNFSIRINAHRKVNEYVFDISDKVAWCESGFFIKNKISFIEDPLWHAGAYYVQEASSMFIDFVCKSLPKEFKPHLILDTCAAPGGKTLILADNFPQSLILANEIQATRSEILEENSIKWGIENTIVINNNVDTLSACPLAYDLVLIDAPCSGSGLFRKIENFAGQWSQEMVNQCSERQKEILKKTLPKINIGGYLIYSTCSFSKEENEDIVHFISQHYEVENVEIPIQKNWNIKITEQDKIMGYRFFPHLTQGEGFFVSVMKIIKEKTNFSEFAYAENKPIFTKLKTTPNLSIYMPQGNTEDFIFYENTLSHSIFRLKKIFEEDFEVASKFLKIKYIGLELGTMFKEKFNPAHALAMSKDILQRLDIKTYECSKEEAQKYLRGETFQINLENSKNWILFTFQNSPIGWIKMIGHRWNNYFPKNWRIKKQLITE